MKNFRITLVHLPDRNHLVSEIIYNGVQWAEISQKNGKLVIQFYSHPKHEYWEFSCEDALKILEQAKNRLLKKTSGERSLFPECPNDPEKANRLGEKLIEEILSHPQAIVYPNRFDGKDIFEPSGKGARYDSNENFMGFLQARGTKS